MDNLTCIDLFAGAGGLSIGLEQAGFKCLYANEVSSSYSKTLEKSHPFAAVETGDIREVNAASVRRSLKLRKGDLSLLAGGPPCQGFSVNAPVRSNDDYRNHLFREYLRFAAEFEPASVLIENVPGILSLERGRTVQEILKALKNLGYDAAVRILYAAHYGVPQMRWRTIILGNRVGVHPESMFPVPSHYAKGRANFTTRLDGTSLILADDQVRAHARLPFTTVSNAIGDLPPIDNAGGSEVSEYGSPPLHAFQVYARQNSTVLTNHQAAGLGAINLQRLCHIPPGGSWRDIPHDLLPAGMKRARRSDHTKRYGRLHPDGIASTILTKCDPHWGSYIHPTQDRILSVREAARLQAFPDSVQFHGSLTEQYEQVGNAVPPLMAKAIGDQISAALFSKSARASHSAPWQEQQMRLAV